MRAAVADLRGRGRRRARARVRAATSGCRSIRRDGRGDARTTRASTRDLLLVVRRLHRARWTARAGRVLFSSVFPDDFDLAGALALDARPADRGRERLQPGRDRRALVRRRARARRRRLRARRRAHRRGDHGRRQADARPRGRGGRARRSSARSRTSTARAASPSSCASSPARRRRRSSPPRGAGDEEALAIVERAERWAGHGIVTTAQLVNPEVVVIGGGVARAGEVLLAPLRRAAGGDGAAPAAPGGLAAGRARPAAGRDPARARRARAAAAGRVSDRRPRRTAWTPCGPR